MYLPSNEMFRDETAFRFHENIVNAEVFYIILILYK